eukprot:TRINITY_DN17641_c0_g1_i2.p1 TRINITY_DN17641_c0_g1~~TRINITY_DN17641_c0_g1_i2.p1  ORF type:complete len:275 (-),score=96.01 TRINITY_DN17641_c0_g1_i2:105-929(-)
MRVAPAPSVDDEVNGRSAESDSAGRRRQRRRRRRSHRDETIGKLLTWFCVSLVLTLVSTVLRILWRINMDVTEPLCWVLISTLHLHYVAFELAMLAMLWLTGVMRRSQLLVVCALIVVQMSLLVVLVSDMSFVSPPGVCFVDKVRYVFQVISQLCVNLLLCYESLALDNIVVSFASFLNSGFTMLAQIPAISLQVRADPDLLDPAKDSLVFEHSLSLIFTGIVIVELWLAAKAGHSNPVRHMSRSSALFPQYGAAGDVGGSGGSGGSVSSNELN